MKSYVHLVVLIILLLLQGKSHAQVYPVQGSASLIPPYALRLSDYATSTSDRMVMNVLLADVTKAELHVRFRISIVGQNVKLETKPEYIGSPITIQGGIPLRLTNIELAEYFDPNHLNFSGISKNDFLKTGFLPEGFYQFCFEVYEYNRGVKISNTICAPAWLILNDPPLINLPMNGSKLKPLSPQNVILQWTPRHTGSPNAAFTTEYEVKVVEVWPANRNPNDAILTQPTIYEATTNSTTLVYGPDATQLEPGRTYAFRVQAKAVTAAEQLDLFKNNGYSETVSFVYGDACDPPLNIVAQAETPSRISLQWDAATSQTGYTVQYRVKGQADANWYSATSLLPSIEISGLQPNTTYEYEVMSTCGSFESTFGNVATITTPDISKQGYVCGVAPGDFNLDPSQLLPILKVGDIVNAGDFDVTITKVSGADGVFTGEGAVVVPFLNQVKGKVAFENITVNNEKRMVNGFMNITGGGVEIVPSSVLNAMDQLSQALNIADSALNLARQYVTPSPDPNTFVADTLITVAGGINKVYKDVATGNIIVVDNSGKTTAIPPGKDIALVDNNGKGVIVNKQGGVTSTTAALAAASAKREYNLSLTFAKAANSKLGFDEQKLDPLKGNYEKLSEAYFVSWKAVTKKSVDAVQATYNGKGLDPSKIKFEQDGNAITPAVSGNTFSLPVNAVAAETPSSIIAKTTGTDGKEQILGKLNVVGYADKPMKLQIVKVNDAKFTASAPAVKAQLDQVYAQTNVTWDVTVTPQSLQVNGLANPFDDGGSGLLSNYTGDMKTVINAAGELLDDTYYLFLIDQPASGNKLGYMPRSKRAGFIFTGPHGNDVARMMTTMAHELGHGAFTLKHTFAEYTSIPQGSTDNLMDYNNGTQLWKYQWDQVHNPAIVLGLFESDEAGESVIAILAKELSINGEGNYFGFLTPSGQRIILSKDEQPIFFHGIQDDSFKDVIPGTLVGFRDSPSKGGAYHWANLSGGTFSGYSNFIYDKPQLSKDDNTVLLGLPSAKKKEGKNFAVHSFQLNAVEDFSGQAKTVLSVASDAFQRYGFFGTIRPFKSYYYDGTKLLGDGQVQISDFELEIINGRCVDFNTLSGITTALRGILIVPHDETPEHFLMVKIAEYYNRYPVFFKQYSSWFDRWNVLAAIKKIAANAPIISDSDVDILFKSLGGGGQWENENVTSSKVNDNGSEYNAWIQNISLHNEKLFDFYSLFLINLQKQTDLSAQSNRDCLKNLGGKKTTREIYDCLIKASEDEISSLISSSDRIYAIKMLLQQFWVDGESEKLIVKLIKFTPSSFDSRDFLTQLQAQCKLELHTYVLAQQAAASTYTTYLCLWEILFSKVNDSGFLISGDNRKELMKALLTHYYRSQLFSEQVTEFQTRLNAFDLDYTEARRFEYDYQGIFRRLWSDLKSYPTLYIGDASDYYVSLNTKILNLESPSTLQVDQEIKKGFFLSATQYSQKLSPFDLVVYTNKSNQDLLKDFSSKDSEGKPLAMPMPALMLHYASEVGNNQTKGEIIQTTIDLGSLLIPGGQLAQLSKLGKVLYYADKISSVASMGATAFETEDEGLRNTFGLLSTATGILSMGNLVAGKSLTTIQKVDNLLDQDVVKNSMALVEDINQSSKIDNLSPKQTEVIIQVIEKDKDVLGQMGRLDATQTARYTQAVTKLRSITRMDIGLLKQLFGGISDDLAARLSKVANIDKLVADPQVVSRINGLDNSNLSYTSRNGSRPKITQRDAFLEDMASPNSEATDKYDGSLRRLVENQQTDIPQGMLDNWKQMGDRQNLRRLATNLNATEEEMAELLGRTNYKAKNLSTITQYASDCQKCYDFYNANGSIRQNIWSDAIKMYQQLGKNAPNGDWADFFATFEAHHIFPKDLLVPDISQNAINSFIKYLTHYKGGINDFNGGMNGIMLKKYSSSLGLVDGVHASHDLYTTKIREFLDRRYKQYSDDLSNKFTGAELEEEIADLLHGDIIKLQSDLKNILIKNSIMGNPPVKVNDLANDKDFLEALK